MGSELRILLVEDHEEIQFLVKSLLEGEGYWVRATSNGEEALEFLKSQEPPHLILLDLMMPVMDGYELSDEIRKDPALSQIPVVVMSADSHAKEQQHRLGARAYLKKPLDIFSLLNAVEEFTRA
jgi:CheY-like chemotaxis protein